MGEYLKNRMTAIAPNLTVLVGELVGEASAKLKGKVSRMLAAKAAIATRVDALGEETNPDLGIEHRAKVESRIRQLEGGQIAQISGSAKKKDKAEVVESPVEEV